MTQPCRSSRGHSTSPEGGGVIWDGMPFETPVIPAKAGIYSANLRKCAVYGVDSSRHGGTGMTGVSKGIPPQMTPPPSGQADWPRKLLHGCVMWPTPWVQASQPSVETALDSRARNHVATGLCLTTDPPQRDCGQPCALVLAARERERAFAQACLIIFSVGVTS